MRYGRRVVFIVVFFSWAFFSGLRLVAQDSDYTATLAHSIASDVSILSAQTTTLARWRQNHRAGKAELAHYLD